MFTAECRTCYQHTRPWAIQQDAENEVMWHVFQEHPLVWESIVGDRIPAALDPQLVAQN